MKKLFLRLFLLYNFLFNISTAFADSVQTNVNNSLSFPITTEESSTQIELEAESAILMDAATGQILYAKNEKQKQYPASITKLLTVLLAEEYHRPDEIITFSKEAIWGIERDSSHIALDVGEEITMEQALYAIMLASANEAAMGVAEKIGGTIDNFAILMNNKADSLGCINSNFINPNGLHHADHYTCAYDMALITKELLKSDNFRKIASTTSYEIPPTNKQPETRYLYAQHKMIKPSSMYYMECCEGGKTGFTDEAFNTLVTFARQDETELICVVLRVNGSGIYTDTQKLFEYGFQNFHTITIPDNFSYSVKVVENQNSAAAGQKDLTIQPEINPIRLTAPINAAPEDIIVEANYESFCDTAKQEGDTLGSLKFYYHDHLIATTSLNIIPESNAISKETLPFGQKENQQKDVSIWLYRLIISSSILLSLGIFMVFLRQLAYRRKIRLRRQQFPQRYRHRY